MKNLESHFQDLLKLVQHVEGKKRAELQVILSRDCGISGPALSLILDALDTITQATSSQAAANQLLKKVHYSQLINFDFKFASKSPSFFISLSHHRRFNDSEQRQVLHPYQDGAPQREE